MNNLYDILEICLQDIENGMDLEKALTRYPEFANELRPILQASINAKQMAVPVASSDMVRRNRAKLLQRAAQMRDEKPVTNSWFPSFQRLAVTLVLLVLFFISGTSLVRASSSALPGDSLYSVKRSWEDVSLFFAFNVEKHETLELEYENERLEEINDLFAGGRPAKVDFAGIVTRQNGDGWRVANILVIISEQTDLPNQPVQIDTAVSVIGTTRGDGIVLAERIELLPSDAVVPEVKDDEPEIEAEQPQATSQPDNQNSTPESGTGAPEIEIATTPSLVSTPEVESLEGILNSINKDVWTVNNILVNVANAGIKGFPVVGASVKVEGYYRLNGVFVAVKIEIFNTGSSSTNINSNRNDAGNVNSNDNGSGDDDNKTNGNGNDDDDNNHNENHNENGNDNNGNG